MWSSLWVRDAVVGCKGRVFLVPYRVVRKILISHGAKVGHQLFEVSADGNSFKAQLPDSE